MTAATVAASLVLLAAFLAAAAIDISNHIRQSRAAREERSRRMWAHVYRMEQLADQMERETEEVRRRNYR